jgi:alpha-N-arabinofuranosidase
MKKFFYLFVIFLIRINLSVAHADNFITIYTDHKIGDLNKKVFGNNIVAYDPTTYENSTKEYYGFSDYGAGIWDSKWQKPTNEVIKLAKDVGISVLRFPGGCGAHHYDWKKAIGKNREHFLYGLDEFLMTSKDIGAEPIITVSYFTGTQQDAADMVEYLNTLDDGHLPWSAQRAKNGHKEPYGVKYFEIGNEDWHGDHRQVKEVLPEEYAIRYLKYYDAMKLKDPSIQIGVILWNREWNGKVMEIIKDKIDFAIIHTYPSPEVGVDKLESMDPKDIFRITLAMPTIRDEYNFQETLKLLHEKSGKNIPLAITEYNGGFVQEKPVPYRHSLGTALVNAELLRIFLQPENNILMANYWDFVNEYWGMIANNFDGTYKTLSNPYYKRPNYYVFEMYHQHFGDVLLNAEVKSDSYDVHMDKPLYKEFINRIKTGTLIKNNLLTENWEISDFAGVVAQEKDGLLGINFQAPLSFNYYHSIKKANVDPNMFYKLSGDIKTENLNDNHGVCLEIQDGRGWSISHSAEETESISGTNDWKYVEVIYKTLPDASAVRVIARRIGEEGPLKGKAYFKDVKLEKFVPGLDSINMAYLSVNASKNLDGKKVFLMVINKNMEQAMTVNVDLKNFISASHGNAWILNGPSIDATNENRHNTVKITQKEFEIKNNPFQYTFEPHSLTAIEIEKEK